jgi:virginiamycin B lyase
MIRRGSRRISTRALASTIVVCLVAGLVVVIDRQEDTSRRLAVHSEGSNDNGSGVDTGGASTAITGSSDGTTTSSLPLSTGPASPGGAGPQGRATTTTHRASALSDPLDEQTRPPAPPTDPRVKLFPTSLYASPIDIAATARDVAFNSLRHFVGRVTPDGTIKEAPTPGVQPDHLAASPDGNLWFTETADKNVGYVTPAGVVTKFPVPDDHGLEFTGIAAGGDGAVWFTMTGYGGDFGFAKLGRVTTDGALTLRPVGDMSLTGLTRGPDGSLWVIDLNKVLRVRTDGSVSSFVAPDGWWMMAKPAVGPDGNLWMIGEKQPPSVMAVFRLTPDGTFTRFALPAGWIDYSHIAAGPDGDLWIVAQSRRSIFRMTLQGSIVEEIDVSDAPWDITVGPDGRMWFTAMKSIGRIDP